MRRAITAGLCGPLSLIGELLRQCVRLPHTWYSCGSKYATVG
jgi:hypothetical protein